MRKRFGELLLDKGLIRQAQLDDALKYQARRGVRLGAALVARGHLTERQLVQALGEALHVPVVSLRDFQPDPAALAMISLRLCSEHDLFPYALRKSRNRNVLTLAMSDPMDFRLLDELGFMTNATIEAVLAPASDIDNAIRRHYGPRLSRAYQEDEVRLALEEDEDGSEMTIYRRGGGVEVVNTQTGPLAVPPSSSPPPTPVPSGRPPRPPRQDSAVLLTEEVPEETPLSSDLQPTERPFAHPQPHHRPPTPRAAPPPTPVPGSVRVPQGPPATAPMSFGGGAPVPTAPTASSAGLPPVAAPTASSSGVPPVPTAPTGSAPALPPVSAPATSTAPAAPTAPPSTPVPTAPMTSGSAGGGFDDALGALIDAATEADHAEAILRLERKFWALMRVLAKKGLLTNEDFLAELGEEEKWRK